MPSCRSLHFTANMQRFHNVYPHNYLNANHRVVFSLELWGIELPKMYSVFTNTCYQANGWNSAIQKPKLSFASCCILYKNVFTAKSEGQFHRTLYFIPTKLALNTRIVALRHPCNYQSWPPCHFVKRISLISPSSTVTCNIHWESSVKW